MASMKQVIHSILISAALVGSMSTARAGKLTVFTPPGGTVNVGLAYIGGGIAEESYVEGGKKDESTTAGEFTITIKDQTSLIDAAVRSAVKVPAPAGSKEKYLKFVDKLSFHTIGLQSYEPLDIEQFVPRDENLILMADFDVPLFLQSGAGFFEGQHLNVVNGRVAGIEGLVFRDISSLFTTPESFYDVLIDLFAPSVNTLPLYSGEVTVSTHLQFRLTEPDSAALLSALLLAMWAATAATRRRKFSPRQK